LDRRRITQILAAIAQNANVKGFADGSIYRGTSKQFCVPGLNCYSCPGALGACPIGAMQALAANPRMGLSLYVYGFILLVGAVSGRFVCGFLCPFGLAQELLHKIPLKKLREFRFFKILSKLKYAVLLVLVVGIPTLLTVGGGVGVPAFCAWLCPAGTLEAGIPLAIANSRIGGAVGWLFAWKVAVLLLVALLSVKIFRPFCRFLCPLGALYSPLNRVSIVHIRTDAGCTGCGKCASSCPMRAAGPDSPECIRCGKCIRACDSGCKRWGARRATLTYREG
jgi:polyferredoxin